MVRTEIMGFGSDGNGAIGVESSSVTALQPSVIRRMKKKKHLHLTTKMGYFYPMSRVWRMNWSDTLQCYTLSSVGFCTC